MYASSVGAFEGYSTLYHFLIDVVKNLMTLQLYDGDGQGKWYHPSTLHLFEILQNIRGLVAHSCVSKNLCNLMINTIYSDFHKGDFVYTIEIQGIF